MRLFKFGHFIGFNGYRSLERPLKGSKRISLKRSNGSPPFDSAQFDSKHLTSKLVSNLEHLILKREVS